MTKIMMFLFRGRGVNECNHPVYRDDASKEDAQVGLVAGMNEVVGEKILGNLEL